MITRKQLKDCMPYAMDENIDKFLEPLNKAMAKFSINTPRRQAAFLAQIAHESGSLKYVKELATGEDYDTGKKAISLGNTPEDDGDGERYKGRGLIQITGRYNYELVGNDLQFNFVANPEAMELPGAAAMVSAWFWDLRGLNRLADIDAFEKITRRINGGLNGYEDRKQHWQRCKAALNVAD